MGKKAIVFSGQGAQFVGMGKDLADSYPACAELFNKADDIIGYELSKICFEGPSEELTKSNHCQPGIFVTGIACYTAMREELGDIDIMGTAGLSLGEWSALHAAGAISFEDSIKVLEARGRFMQEACEERDGSMVSVIGLPVDKLDEICVATGVEKANLNSPEQIVLSGERKGIEEAGKMAKDMGAKRAIVLNVAGAFHSSLMNSAAERLEEFLVDINISQPSVPVVANVTGAPHGTADEIKSAMISQVRSSVHWYDCVKWFMDSGSPDFCECGPGKVLSGLIKRIDREAVINNIQDVDSLNKAVEAFKS